ncbi:MAG: carbohydrate-binding domain-containing protein, partial [Flavobacterium sp.]
LPCKDLGSNGYQVSFIEDEEWLQYTVDAGKQNSYNVAIRYSAENTEGKLHLEIENGKKTESIALPSTGGNDKWKTVVLPGIQLNKGSNKIKVIFDKGNFNLNYLEFNAGKK